MVRPCRAFMHANVAMFQNITLIIAAKAAPVTPKRGTATTLSETFRAAATSMIVRNVVCRPVMFMNIPVGPEVEFTNWPRTRKTRAG